MKKFLSSFYRGLVRLLSGSGLYRVPVIRKLNKYILTRLKRNTANLNGFEFRLDPRDSLNLSIFKNYEPFETDFIKSMLRKAKLCSM